MMNPRVFLFSRPQLTQQQQQQQHDHLLPAQRQQPRQRQHPSQGPLTPRDTNHAPIAAVRRKHEPASKSALSNTGSNSVTDHEGLLKMGKPRDPSSLSPQPMSRSPPSTTATHAIGRPSTSSSAVEIPVKPQQDTAHKHKHRHHGDAKRRPAAVNRTHRSTHSPDAMPPSVAALLALTTIPPPSKKGSLQQRRKNRMTVDSIVPRSQVSEKDLSDELAETLSLPSMSRGSPMDVLLSPPDELEEDDYSVASEGEYTSAFSTRVDSLESLPSLGDSVGTSMTPSFESPVTPRSRRFRQPRRSLEPVVSPPGEGPNDPLSCHDAEDLDFSVFDRKPASDEGAIAAAPNALRSVFKSNLTASLRALRSAARTISTFTASSIPPDDFLTRSILTIDPSVPFTDERMPPVMEEEPSEAMRRYLNPTSSSCPESRSPPNVRGYTASIQMRTYKVQRSRSALGPGSRSSPQANPPKQPSLESPSAPRQREMRENSDFIRIAVMEHLMRKRGKLDDQREGHARWLLPRAKLPRSITRSAPMVSPHAGARCRQTLEGQARSQSQQAHDPHAPNHI